MRVHFDEQLKELNSQLVMMGTLCEQAIALAAKSLLDGDLSLAKQVAEVNEKIGRMESDIEAMCLKLFMQQQPVARDLRQISSALKMVTDMQRIGTQAGDIADIVLSARVIEKNSSIQIGDMARATIKMVTDSIDAFVRRDTTLAQEVVDYDDVVDDLFIVVRGELVDFIKTNPSDAEYSVDLFMVAKYLERIGDHAVNIAKWVLFAITGSRKYTEGSESDLKE